MRVRPESRPQKLPSKNSAMNRYYRSQTPLSSSPFAKKKPLIPSKRRHFFTKLIDYIVVIAIALGVLYSLIVNPVPRLDVSSFEYHSIATYQAAADSQFSSLQNRSKLTINEQAIESNMKKQFPEISAATVSLPLFGQKPTLHLTIASPAFYLNSNGHRYVIDKSGIVVGEAQGLPIFKDVPQLSDESGFVAKPGSPEISTSSIGFINQLVAQCKESKVPISSLVLPPLAQELDLHTSDKPYYVKFYLGGNASIQIGQFLAARHDFALSNINPSQYLDVRVAGKIYYK